jgi:hypothetical protein
MQLKLFLSISWLLDCGKFPGSLGRSSKDIFGHAPWHVTLFQTFRPGMAPIQVCSGTLIEQALVLTSGNCLREFKGGLIETENLRLRFGPWNETDRTFHEVKYSYSPKCTASTALFCTYIKKLISADIHPD